jgi:hypothetical protein
MARNTDTIERIKVNNGNSIELSASNFLPPKTPIKMMIAILEAIPVYLRAKLGCSVFF